MHQGCLSVASVIQGVEGAKEPWGGSLQELYATAPSYKRRPQPPGARPSHLTHSQATTLFFPPSYPLSMVFFFQNNFSYIILLLIYTATARWWIPQQRYGSTELCLGLKEANSL